MMADPFLRSQRIFLLTTGRPGGAFVLLAEEKAFSIQPMPAQVGSGAEPRRRLPRRRRRAMIQSTRQGVAR